MRERERERERSVNMRCILSVGWRMGLFKKYKLCWVFAASDEEKMPHEAPRLHREVLKCWKATDSAQPFRVFQASLLGCPRKTPAFSTAEEARGSGHQ